MANEDPPVLSLEGLSLVPLDEPPEAVKPASTSRPVVDTRHKVDRRSLPDRRASIRFQESRRSGKPRRPEDNPWAPGSGL